MNRNGLKALVTPEESILLLMDHQPFQFANLHSHEPQMIVNNVIALAKGAKAFGVPTILTTINASTGGVLLPGIQEVFPEQPPIDRTMINTWQDERVVKLVRESGRKKVIMAGLWTEICVAMPVIHAMGEGWDVTFVPDASGGVSHEAHDLAVRRMIAAGANPMTWLAVLGEWQRDWARMGSVPAFAKILVEHAGGSGVAFVWEQQLLHSAKSAAA
jgi:nicotinamidase-related amidase